MYRLHSRRWWVLSRSVRYFLTYLSFSIVPDGSPLSLSANIDMKGSIFVTWIPPRLRLRNGQINHYRVVYTNNNSLDINQWSTIIIGATLSCNLTDLQPDTLYYISVAAGTSAGFGPYANTSVFTGICKPYPTH